MDITERAVEYVRKLFNTDAGGHDVSHTMRVYENAMLISEKEPGGDNEIIALAALLHDADDPKLFNTGGNANARAFLKEQGVPPEKAEKIIGVINSVSFSRNKGKRPETQEGRIVQDADRLDAMGAVGIARTFAYGGAHGRPLESSVRHFHEKLLLLKDALNTEIAKKIADSRHAFLVSFLRELEAEAPDLSP